MRSIFQKFVVALVLLLTVAAPGAAAGVDVSFDAETIGMMLRAASKQDIEIPISDSRTLLVQIKNVQLLKLEPVGDTATGRGLLRTSVDLSVPEFNLDLSLKPTVVLDVVKGEQFNELEMRFVTLAIPIPIIGDVDIAPFLTPLRYPAEDLWYLAGARGIVHLRSHLVGITMGQRAIRFEFDLELSEDPTP